MGIPELAVGTSVASRTGPRRPGLPTDMLFRLFRAAVKDEDDIADPVIQSAYEDMVSYDQERARGVMELIVRRQPLAWSALYALLAEARDAQPSISGLPSEYY
jgi:hypothetical protein